MSAGQPHDPHDETITARPPNESPTTDDPDGIPKPLPKIPGYHIVRRLGGGGMGDVYEAVDEKLGVAFALKMVRPDRTALSYAERFRQEVKAMMVLDHPNVTRIYHHDDVDGWPYFTMKFVRGGTLADRRGMCRDDPRAAVQLMIKVADAVHYLHARGMVHRDLKPSNILIDESGEPILSDFGLVKDVVSPTEMIEEPTTQGSDTKSSPSRAAEAPTLTRTGGVLGTYAYMSPEQARGQKGAVAPTTDVWALGVILYELLTGHRPGEHWSATTSELSRANASVGREPPGVDPALAAIAGRCLAEDPKDRYPSASLVADDLRSWLRSTEQPVPRFKPGTMIAAAIVLAAVAVTVAVAKWGRNPKLTDKRAWVRDELRGGRPVTLIDGDGNAMPIVKILGNGHADRNPAGWWTVQSTDKVLAEFLDDPGVESFTLTAEVRGNRLASIPYSGLYVAHRQVGDWHFQLEYLYRESPGNFRLAPPPGPAPPLKPNQKRFKPVAIVPIGKATGKRLVRLHGTQLSQGDGENPEDLHEWDVASDAPTVGGPWRQMGIRARGTTFTVSWARQEEFTTPEFSAGRLDKMQALLREGEFPDPPLAFTARGGLGIYVSGGATSFRNVVIVPGVDR